MRLHAPKAGPSSTTPRRNFNGVCPVEAEGNVVSAANTIAERAIREKRAQGAYTRRDTVTVGCLGGVTTGQKVSERLCIPPEFGQNPGNSSWVARER